MTCWQLRFSTCCCWAPIGVDPSSVGEINHGKSIYVKLSITWSRGTREYIYVYILLLYYYIFVFSDLLGDPSSKRSEATGCAQQNVAICCFSFKDIWFFGPENRVPSNSIKSPWLIIIVLLQIAIWRYIPCSSFPLIFFAEVWEIYRPNPGRSPSPSKSHCFL